LLEEGPPRGRGVSYREESSREKAFCEGPGKWLLKKTSLRERCKADFGLFSELPKKTLLLVRC
jgi:hypothetical protein